MTADPDPRKADLAALFDRLYTAYEHQIAVHLSRLCRGDAERAADLAQDTWRRVWEFLPAFTLDHPQAWVYRIATNVFRDETRHLRLITMQPWDAYTAAFHPSHVDARAPDPERTALAAEAQEEFEAILQKLRPVYRTVLALRAYHDLPYLQIAAHLGTTRAAVKSLLTRARAEYQLWASGSGPVQRPPAGRQRWHYPDLPRNVIFRQGSKVRPYHVSFGTGVNRVRVGNYPTVEEAAAAAERYRARRGAARQQQVQQPERRAA